MYESTYVSSDFQSHRIVNLVARFLSPCAQVSRHTATGVGIDAMNIT